MDDRLRKLHQEYLHGSPEAFGRYNNALIRAGLETVMPLHVAKAVIKEWPKKKPKYKSRLVDGIEVKEKILEPKQAERVKTDEARQVCLVYFELMGWKLKFPNMWHRQRPKGYFASEDSFLPDGFPVERDVEYLPYYAYLSPDWNRYLFFAGNQVHIGSWVETSWDVYQMHIQTIAYSLFQQALRCINGR